MDAQLLAELNTARAARAPVTVVTDLASGDKRLVTADEVAGDPQSVEIISRLKSGKSGIVQHEGVDSFIEVYVPPPRLVIIGAVHISQALAPMAKACDFDVTVIDPRTAFATEERFGGVALHAEWPEEILKANPLDAFTAMVTVTHDPKIDDYPLQAALETGCFYVGALGSRKTHAKRLDRLATAGLSLETMDRIHAPIGLDIGAASPAEIAVAVMAQIIEALRKAGKA